MLIVYDSLTGMGRRFAESLGYPTLDIKQADTLDEPCLLVTRSFNFGEVTEDARIFLDKNKDHVIGVVVSGNKNWGTLYGKAGDIIQEEYGIPLVLKFEVTGFPSDKEFVKKFLEDYING